MRSECARFQINDIDMYVMSSMHLILGQMKALNLWNNLFVLLTDWAYASFTPKILITCLNAKKIIFVCFLLNWSIFGYRIVTHLDFILFISFYIDSEQIDKLDRYHTKYTLGRSERQAEEFFNTIYECYWIKCYL